MNKDFFIGWSTETPQASSPIIRLTLAFLAVTAIMSAAMVAYIQAPFSRAKFELGTKRELKGTLRLQPFPFLQLDDDGRQLLLVGPGKSGGAEQVRKLELKTGQKLADSAVRATGKLIFRDGKTAFEIMTAAPLPGVMPANAPVPVSLGRVNLRGEITDPKCLLGVMKPGEGLTHRECAIRCIAGGITPLLKVSNAKGDSEHYLISGPDGESVNECLLPFVGTGVDAEGELIAYGDWLTLKINPAKTRKINKLSLNAPMCGK